MAVAEALTGDERGQVGADVEEGELGASGGDIAGAGAGFVLSSAAHQQGLKPIRALATPASAAPRALPGRLSSPRVVGDTEAVSLNLQPSLGDAEAAYIAYSSRGIRARDPGTHHRHRPHAHES